MLSCQEMSHAPPTTLERTAMTFAQMYQGTTAVAVEARASERACTSAVTEMESAMAHLSGENVLAFDTHQPGKKLQFTP
jgi:hypothetical protein